MSVANMHLRSSLLPTDAVFYKTEYVLLSMSGTLHKLERTSCVSTTAYPCPSVKFHGIINANEM